LSLFFSVVIDCTLQLLKPASCRLGKQPEVTRVDSSRFAYTAAVVRVQLWSGGKFDVSLPASDFAELVTAARRKFKDTDAFRLYYFPDRRGIDSRLEVSDDMTLDAYMGMHMAPLPTLWVYQQSDPMSPEVTPPPSPEGTATTTQSVRALAVRVFFDTRTDL
jgi:hypothetical protein